MVVVCTEDVWATQVRPRLEVAKADLKMVKVVCAEKDGSGTPIFPNNIGLLEAIDPTPALIVVDCWLDTVPTKVQVRDPQQARLVLHPWRELATRTGTTPLLLAHTNRVGTSNARDKYGITSELRKKCRMSLFGQADEDGRLQVGPEKANGAAPLPASTFEFRAVQFFDPTPEDDGKVPHLKYMGESDKTAKEHLADNYAAQQDTTSGENTKFWLRMFLLKGPRWSDDVHNAADAVGHTESKVKTAKRKLLVQTKRDGKIGAWYMYLPDHEGQVPEGRPREKHEDQEEQEDNQEEQEVNADTVSRPIDFLTSCPLAQDQEVISTSQEGKRMNGEVRGEDDFLPSGEPTPDEVSPVAETTKPGNVGNGKEHVFDFEAFKARVLDGHNESRAKRLEAEQ